MFLLMFRVLINELNYDMYLRQWHYERAADILLKVRNHPQFQSFLGGYVFPVFVAMYLSWWAIEEDKSFIPVQFLLMPLAYVPISIVGFTLVNAEFSLSYLYVNPLVILTFGYIYVLFWYAFIVLMEKLGLVN